jgi:sensor histidine kinase YesM
VSLAFSSGFLINDPEHAPFGATWLRGITSARLVVLTAVCLMISCRPALIATDNFPLAMERLLLTTVRTFVSALPMFLLVIEADRWTVRSPLRVRVAALLLAVVAGALVYPAAVDGFHLLTARITRLQSELVHLARFIQSLVFGALLTTILFFAARERDTERHLRRTQVARAEVERQIVESRLQQLQAQIEPHFLFNSLASVKRLYEREPAKGRALLRSLREYLRESTRGARQREVPLGGEIALARSFLEIFQVRMGLRLHVHIDVSAGLESELVPPLMIATLVENAIKHGLASRASGGTVFLAARRRQEFVEIEVRDDGVGFRARSGHGVGLANIRARLDTLYADAASLDLASNTEGGVTATIRVPCRSAAAGTESR